MVMLGVLARLKADERLAVVDRLQQIEGVSTFLVDDDDRLGILIEGHSLERAHETLTVDVAGVRGVLGAWPVFTECEPEPNQILDGRTSGPAVNGVQ